MNQSQLEQSLLNRLQISERNLSSAVRISNHCFRTFINIARISNEVDSNEGIEALIPFLDWLQSFLIILRDNVKHFRVERNQLREWYQLRLSLR